ncbi:MAG: hypothetical protein PUG77_04170, partial [Helicobacter bilis]
LHYHGRFNNIKNSVRNSIIKNSRFLSWFILRYKTNINTYVGYIARSVDEADIYLSNPNINKISLIFDIFSHLIRKESIGYRKYKYNESIKSYASHNKKDILLKLALWYENDLDFIRFNSANKVNNISKANKSICRQVNSGIDELKKLESWDYDIAMLYLTLQGYKFIEARLHFLDSPKDLQKQYQQAFEVLESICKSNNSRDKNKNKEITEKLQPHLEHSHIKAYIEYYHFLYIQRKFELAAQEKNLKKFKKHLYKAQNLIDQLLIDNTQHIYLFTKMKKHKANIMNLIWHIELKEIGRQLEDPFNIELKDNAENKGAYDILSKSNKLYKHIESMLKTNTNPYLKNPKNT